MSKTVHVKAPGPTKRGRPALTPEARENQMIAKAIDLAERQLDEGTASSQVITHFLKLGTIRHQIELEKLKSETELAKAKKEALASSKNMEELYLNAIKAMQIYGGHGSRDESDE